MDGCRFKIINEYGETSGLDSSPPLAVYKDYFAGVSWRYYSGRFREPETNVMIPTFAAYHPGPQSNVNRSCDHGGLRDPFLALTVKIGLGFDAMRLRLVCC